MAAASIERRLAAILAADVVGYSRLMGADERGTLERLKAHRREFIDPTVTAHHGRTVKLMGDGALVEFASVVDAVACAAEIQRGMALRNAEVSNDRRIWFRVGINLGDVIVEGDDIYGDGVNVAARLEALAEPGDIIISGTAFDQVEGKLDYGFEFLGEKEVKNIAKLVRVYRVRTEAEAGAGVVPAQPPRRRVSRRFAAVALGLTVLIAIGAAGWGLYLQPLLQERAFAKQTALPLPDKPSIAVLPFANMSGDPAQGYFSDGITENVITNLSKLSGLFVIARNTAFTYKDRAVNIPEVGRELGVRYVLEGSVQRGSDRVRIHAQLIDAATGFHVWAEQFDRELGDVFALQDEVTTDIVAALEVELSEAERRALAQRYTDSLEAYDAFLQGWEQVWRATYDANLRAREHFERAIRLDPGFARAYAALSLTYTTTTGLLLPEGSLEQAYDLAQTAMALDDSLPQVDWALAEVHLHRGELEEALAASDKVLALEPNYADAHAQRASILHYLGRPQEALTVLERAMRLNPRYNALYLQELGKIEFTMRHYEDAIATLEVALERNPNLRDVRLYLAASYAYADRIDDAEWQVLEMLTADPEFSIEGAERLYSFRLHSNPAYREHLIEGLRRAGLTE